MKTAAALLTGAAIGAAVCYVGVRLCETWNMNDEPRCEARVQIVRSGTTFVVKPKNVCLYAGHHLKWEVNTPSTDKVEIVFNSPGPFKYDPDNNPDNTAAGVYMTTTPKDIASNEAVSTGRFPYTVKWTPAGGTPQELDPAVCIRR